MEVSKKSDLSGIGDGLVWYHLLFRFFDFVLMGPKLFCKIVIFKNSDKNVSRIKRPFLFNSYGLIYLNKNVK